MSSADVHVTPLEKGWELRRSGERFPTSRHRTRWSALKNAREMAAASRAHVIVHGLDGSISIEQQGPPTAGESA
jgi:hypothetical protein